MHEYVFAKTQYGVAERYLERRRAHALASGLTHAPFVWSEGGRVVFNPGSVGQPSDRDSRASYAVLRVGEGSRILGPSGKGSTTLALLPR